MSTFTRTDPTLENYWRAIILFGSNVASYKFALARSLLSLGDRAGAAPFGAGRRGLNAHGRSANARMNEHQGIDLARRKPIWMLLGVYVLRNATGAYDVLLPQPPPRITRLYPDDGPGGSVVATPLP